ncbi:MAG: hypothetical protein M3396_08730 [Actinomycetota bacterium]|nr:hypothetical protein [Actinomycetota bacterium]MDQ3573547.1 hypothetical protein [Actinomycetota bacterium]
MAAEEEVRLRVPATPELLRLARVTASGVASRLRFSYDEVEDLRLAIDELCFALTGGKRQDGWLVMRYTIWGDGETMEVQGTASFPPDGSEPVQNELSAAVLAALVDEHEVYRDGDGSPSFRLVKRRSTSP